MSSTAVRNELSPFEAKPVVLTTVPYCLPGFKGGGKLITVRNLVAGLSNRFRFKVLTANRDLGSTQSYEGIPTNQWSARADCEVFYADFRRPIVESIREQLAQDDYDILHLNTIFSWPFGIVPLLVRRFVRSVRRPTVIAPRGELAPAALAIKPARKKGFLAAAHRLGLFEDATWQASGDEEGREIRNVAGAGARIAIGPDLLAADYGSWSPSRYRKHAGRLDIVFLSRISPKKNLHLAIEALYGLKGDIRFRIVGPIDDATYWARCRKSMAALGSNIQVDYRGPISTSEVGDCFARHGLLLLPTANENFGFVILEALLAGCPVLISDQTPWRRLGEKGIGWDLPLVRMDLLRSTLQHCVEMDRDAHRRVANRAREFALDYIARDDSAARNAAMFYSMLPRRAQDFATA